MSLNHPATRQAETPSGTSVNMVDALKAEIEDAIRAGDESRAAEAHDRLVKLEHREDLAATVRKHAR